MKKNPASTLDQAKFQARPDRGSVSSRTWAAHLSMLPVAFLFTAMIALPRVSFAAAAAAAGNDVFLDEGDGDFDPAPSLNASSTEAVPGASGKKDAAKALSPSKQAAATLPDADTSSPSGVTGAPPGASTGESTEDSAASALSTTTEPPAPTVVPQEEAPPAPEPQPKKSSHSKHAAKEKKSKASKVASGGKFMTTKDSCPMMREPASEGSPMIVVKPSRRIWVELVDENWVRGFNKAGEPGYLSKECFQ